MVSNLSISMTAKTARPCDSCIRKRARWYCAADDAFLCQSCDGSVHSANPLARRHERVRLKTTSVDPPWTTGFTRKPRTPRRKTKSRDRADPVDERVPEIGVEETTSYDEMSEELTDSVMFEVPFIGFGDDNDYVEFDEFAGGGVESLLGFDIEDLGLDESMEGSSGSGRVKSEKEEEDLETDQDIINANFGKYPLMVVKESSEEFEAGKVKKKVLLALDYDGVIAAWAGDRSPWTTGDRPEVDPTDTWPNFPGNKGMIYYTFSEHDVSVNGQQTAAGGLTDGGREARVSRYREKRRNRLFSKKIRYEVRKLNAEKRPRMKGRFVKRSSFASPPVPPSLTLLNK